MLANLWVRPGAVLGQPKSKSQFRDVAAQVGSSWDHVSGKPKVGDFVWLIHSRRECVTQKGLVPTREWFPFGFPLKSLNETGFPVKTGQRI